MSRIILSLIDALAELCKEKDIRVTASESLKGGAIAGASAFLGGLILGPVGLALGGALGGAVAAASCNGKFESAAVILKKMPYHKKELLYNKIKANFRNIGYAEVTELLLLITSTTNLKEIALNETLNFLKSDMNLKIVQ